MLNPQFKRLHLVEVSDETNSTEINETNSNTHEETNVLTNVHSSPIETVTERNFNFQHLGVVNYNLLLFHVKQCSFLSFNV